MKNYRFTLVIILLALLAVPIVADHAAAQVIDFKWSSPLRLSSSNASAGPPFMTSDQFGYVHLFWKETGLVPGRDVIQYARFDGEVWEGPVNIFLSGQDIGISNLSVDVDSSGLLHLIWIETDNVFYSTAPAYDALNARNWEAVRKLNTRATFFDLRVTDDGTIHTVYSQTTIPGNNGVYYQRSIDYGFNWDTPIRLDPDRPENLLPSIVRFETDDNGGLHAVWYYLDLNDFFASSGTWVRYAHSLDGGLTWSAPFTIDDSDESDDELRMAFPNIIVSGNEVHVIWAGDSSTHREHRYSTDYGVTWSATRQIFGNLQGQARGDGLAVDSSGRVHFDGQIRWPMGLYYSYFQNDQWAPESLFYLIKANSNSPSGEQIAAHDIRLEIQGGDYLVTAFGDTPGAPNRGLYVMMKRISDTPALVLVPTPTPQPTATPNPTATPGPTATPTATQLPPLPANANLPGSQNPPVNPGFSFYMSFLFTTAFIGIVFIVLRVKRRRS